MKWRFWDIGVKFEPRDLWIGVYWDYRARSLWIYVCAVPMFPLFIVFQHEKPRPAKDWDNTSGC